MNDFGSFPIWFFDQTGLLVARAWDPLGHRGNPVFPDPIENTPFSERKGFFFSAKLEMIHDFLNRDIRFSEGMEVLADEDSAAGGRECQKKRGESENWIAFSPFLLPI